MMKRPGKTPSHQAREMKLRESARIRPQVGVEASTPRPRKERRTLARIA